VTVGIRLLLSPMPSRLASGNALRDINPAFEGNANIVPISPEQSTLSNRKKVIERDEKTYRNEAQPICMHNGPGVANVVSPNSQFGAGFKKQQAIFEMSDHCNPICALPRRLWYLRKHVMQPDDSRP
jgi:hypothetical protein